MLEAMAKSVSATCGFQCLVREEDAERGAFKAPKKIDFKRDFERYNYIYIHLFVDNYSRCVLFIYYICC